MISYTDNIKVKISEKYKPPPRINLAISYAQRLTLNKQIQDNIPNYNFSLENYVIEKMKEWKANKVIYLKQRQSKLELKRQKLEARKELAKNIEVSEAGSLSDLASKSCTSEILRSDLSDKHKIQNSSILTPTQASTSYSTILKPVQLQNYGNHLNNKEIDKNKHSFNLSDFENDTSSPFDNMELKSINDLEELAQVLNQEDNDQKLKTSLNVQDKSQSIYAEETQTSQLNFNDYLDSHYSGRQYLYTIPSILTSVKSQNENFLDSNGYKYPTGFTDTNQSYNPYTWTKPNRDSLPFELAHADSKKSNCKSVPDLVNALEIELDNFHISNLPNSKISGRFKDNLLEGRPKSVDEVSTFHKIPQNEESSLKLLSKDEQNLCKSISIMGFPLERVATAYKLLGNDEKKVSMLPDNFFVFQMCNKYVESIKNVT